VGPPWVQLVERIVAAPPASSTVDGEISATIVTPEIPFSESRIAVKRSARNCN